MGKKDIEKKLQDMVDKKIHEKTIKIVKQIVKDVSAEIHSAIENFYNDSMSVYYNTSYVKDYTYAPYTYERQYGLEDMYRVFIKKTDTGHIVTFRFAPEFETAQHTRWSGITDDANEWVFALDFLKGYHGGYIRQKNGPIQGKWRRPTVITTPSPWAQIREYVSRYKVPEV